MIGDILQPTHLLLILAVALLVLGPKRLPEVGRALGRGLRDFRNALSTEDLHDQMIGTTSVETGSAFDPEPTAPTAVADPAPPVPPHERSPDEGVPASPEPAASAPAADRTA